MRTEYPVTIHGTARRRGGVCVRRRSAGSSASYGARVLRAGGHHIEELRLEGGVVCETQSRGPKVEW